MKRKLVSTRVFALILVVAMVITIIPLTALADDSLARSRTQTEYSGDQNASGNVALQEEADEAADVTGQDPTTAAPEPTTAAPEPTTAAPEPTTAAPEETTAAPEETTAAPEETTAAPEETTAAPEETTAAPEETTEEETTKAEEEDKMSAQDFYGIANGVEVSVKAPQGAFPDHTRMIVTSVSDDAVLDAVQGALNSEVSNLRAVDITFYNKEGIEIHPAKEIRVVLRALGMAMAAGAERDVVHIDDFGNAEVVNDANITGTKAVFNSDEFSIYVIADGEQIETYRRTYQFLNEIDSDGAATPYTFYNKAGELVDNQIIKNGDVLEDVGTPRELGKTFLGWFLATKSGDTYEYTDEEVTFGSAISLSLTADETVYVAPKYEAVYYVTFHETVEGGDDDVIQTKKVVYTSGSDANKVLISDVIAPQLDSDHIFYGWSYDGTNYTIYDDESQIKTTYIEDIESDIDLYPFFTEAYWLRFVSAEHGANATYIESRFVLAEDTITSLPVPTRKGYEFSGWYTGSQDDEGNITYDEQITDETGTVVISGGLKLTESLTLYGKWDADTATTYNVVFWKQKVTDDKDAATEDKTYDYWDSEVRNGTTGAEVEVTSEDTGRTETGFHYARYNTTSATISADGNTTVNVYYDRDLVSVNFYYRSNVPGSGTAYEYTPTTSENMPPQQYGLLEDGTYVELQKTNLPPIVNVYYTYNNWGITYRYTDTFYTRSGPWYDRVYTATEYNGNNLPPSGGTTYYGYTGIGLSGYSELTRREETIPQASWSYQQGGETIPYIGTRYTRREVQGYNHMITFTGLYGQSFDQNKYEWPADYRWYEGQYGQGTGQTFLIDFTKGDGYKLYEYGASGSYSLYHFKQGLDDKYHQDEAFTAKFGYDSATFNFENKFDGFTVASYSRSFNENGTGTTVSPGSSREVDLPIYVYHKRSKHQIDYNVDGTIEHSEKGIYFEAPLDDYNIPEEEAPYVKKDHYVFKGWYADETCTEPFDFTSTMPNGNLVLYAGYEVERYDVNVDPDGGVITSAIGATHFTVDYNEKITRYNGVDRNYIEDPDGAYKYVINFTDTDRTATYEIAEAGYSGTRYRPITSSDPQYSLIGWYEVIDGSISSTPYDFDEPVTKDTTIRAVWKLSGSYKVQYTAVTDVDGVTVSGTINIPQKEIDAQYADRSEIIVQKGPTNVTAGYVFDGWQVVSAVDGDVLDDNDGNYYQTGDELMLHASWADSGRLIHIQAHYTKVDESTDPVPITKLIFDANGGVLTEAPAITDKNGNTCTPTVASNTAKYEDLPINQDYALSQINDKVTRDGFDLIGWNTNKAAADNGDVEFGLDVTVGVDELDSNTNTLYACWSKVVEVEITGSSDEKEYNGSKQENDAYTVKYFIGGEEVTTLPDGVTATFSSTGDNDGDTTNLKAVGKDVGTYTTTVTVELASTNPAYKISPTKGSASDDIVLKITAKAVTITVANAEKDYGDNDPAFADATLEGGIGTDLDGIDLTVSRTNTDEDVNTYTDVLNIGQTADELNEAYPNYTFTIEPGDFTINPKEVTVTADPAEKTYGDPDPTAADLSATVEGVKDGDTITYTLALGDHDEDVGTYNGCVTVSGEEEQGNYKVKYVNGDFTINPKEVTVTADPAEKTYGDPDPTAEDLSATVDGLKDGDTIDYTLALGNHEEKAGTYIGCVTVTGEEEQGNYKVKYVNGDFTIKTAALKITAKKQTYPYNGEMQGPGDISYYDPDEIEELVTVEGLCFDDKLTSITLDGQGTDVGEYALEPSAANVDNADSYEIEYVKGILEITPLDVTVTITGHTGEEVYDSKEYKVEGYDVDISNPLYTESEFTFSGTAEAKGSDPGKYPMGLTESQFLNGNKNFNVTFDVTDGWLLITKPGEIVVTIKGAKKTELYDGTLKQVNDYEVTIPEGADFTEADVKHTGEATAEGINAGTYEMGLAEDQFSVEKTKFDVVFQVTDGKLTIKKRTVKLTSDSATKEYDGTALEKPEVTVDGDGFVDGEVTDLKATGSIIKVGSVDNTITYTEGAAFNADNYVITKKEGTLEITQNTANIQVKSGDDSKKYDGTELTCDEATVTGLPEGFTYEVEITGTITDAGEKANKIKSFKILNEDGEDVTDQFANIKLTEGTLTVEKRDVTLTSATDEKAYDGKPLTNDEITVGGDGWAEGEGAEFNVTGSQTYVGSSENTFTYQLNGGTKVMFANLLSAEKIAATKEGNYNIEKVYGTLTVTDEGADASVQKTHKGDKFKAGDVVEFEITAENIYDENKTITFTEQEGVTITSDSVFKNVKPGETVTATAEYTITDADVAKGSFTNTAEVTFSGVDKVYEATDTVNTGKENPHLTIDKKTTSKPANGGSYVLGEKITYKITVTNDGNVPVEDITVEDPLTGDSWTIKVLKPGESKVFTASYVVTEDDVKKGTVHNDATAKTKKDIPVTPGSTDDKTSSNGKKTPKTGDDNNMALWLIILLLSGATIGGQFILRRSRRKEEE